MSREISEAVVRIGRREAPWIGDEGQIVAGIVAELRNARPWIRDLLESIERVVDIAGCTREGCANRRRVAIAVVGKRGRDAGRTGRIDVLIQLAQQIEGFRVSAVKSVTGVVRVLRSAVTQRIQRIADSIARAIRDLRQPVSVVVRVEQIARIGQRHLLE